MKKINTLFPELNKQTYNTINHIETKEECIFCKNTGIKKQGYDFGQPCNCEYGKKIKLDNVSEEVKEKLSNTMLFLRDEPADYDNTIEINIDKSKEEYFCVECNVDFHPKGYYNNAILQRIKDAFIVDTDNAKILYESLMNRFRNNEILMRYLNKVESEENTSEFV